MKTRISLNKVFWSFLVVTFLIGSLAFAAPVGKITAVEGRVDVLKAGKNVATPISLGATVDIGDIYRAKSKSRAEITFVNNNILRIGQSSRVEIKEYMVKGEQSTGIIRLHRGRVQALAGTDFIKRAAALAEGNKFEVHTPNAVAGIRGTNMLVSLIRGATMVVFVTGQGYLYNPNLPTIVAAVTAGHMSSVPSANTPPTAPKKASQSQINNALQQVTPTGGDTGAGGGSGAGDTGAGTSAGAGTGGTGTGGTGTGGTDLGPDGNLPGPLPQDPVIQVVVVPDPPPPPPPPPPEPPAPAEGVNLTGTLEGMPFEGGGTLSDTTLTANIPVSGTGTISASGTVTGDTGTTHPGTAKGTSDTGGAFIGYTPGVQGSWLNRLSFLYLEGGSLYFLTGDAPGTFDGTTFSFSGSLTRSGSVGTITPTPAEGQTLLCWFNSTTPGFLPPELFPTATPFTVSDSGIEITPSDRTALGGYRVTNEGNKVNFTSDIYKGNFGTTETPSLPYLGHTGIDQYGIGPLSYTNDATNHKFTIDANLDFIGVDPQIGPYLGTYSMRYLGMYDVDIFRMSGAGNSVITHANFFGDWGPLGSLYYNDSGTMMVAGEDNGYFGGTAAPWTSPVSFTAMGVYDLSPADRPHYLMNTYMSATTTEDVPLAIMGSMQGFTGAIWKGGNAATVGTISGGTLRAVYVSTPDGNGYVTTGVMKSDVSGSYYPFLTGSKMWKIDGTLTPTPYAMVLDPNDLTYAVGSMAGGLSGDFNGTGSIYGEASGDTMFLATSSQSLPFGILNIKFGYDDNYNYYDYKPEGNPSWSAKLGGFGVFENESGWIGYWLLTASGTWTDTGEVTGNVTGKAMTPLYLYDAEGRFSGVNSEEVGVGYWIGQVIGSYYNGTYLKFFSEFYADMLDAVNDDGVYFGLIAEMEGFLGGTASLWSGSNIPITIMGSVGGECLWYTPDPIASFNVLTESYTTYDGGAYYGLAGGNEYAFKDIASAKTLEGKFVALYIDNSATPKAGVLQAYLSGDIYPEINMFEMEGLANRTEKSEDIGLSASGLAYNINAGSLDGTGAYLSGIFKQGATVVSGMFGYEDLSYPGSTCAIATEPWGIYGLPMLGQFNTLATVPTSWSATVGSTGTFGAYKDALDDVWGDWGYWLASITGSVPAGATVDEGILYGTLAGQYITYTRLGTMDGDVYGTYEDTGLWKAVALGTWTGTDLTFVSDVDVGLFHYSTAWDTSDGWLYGLMGGTGTLWTGSPVAARMISQYNSGDGFPKIWNANIYSNNYKNNTYTTYDGGAYNGFFAGRVVGDDLYGRQVAIYISPQSGGKYEAGFLRGDFMGNAYPDIYMAEMIGLLITKPKNDDIGIAPTSLTFSPWSFPPVASSSVPPLWVGNNVTQPKSLWGTGEGWEIMSTGNAWNYTMALYNTTAHTAEPWGIYSMSHGGTYSGTPPAGWTGTIGGSGVFGAYYSTPQAAFYDDYGYYLTSISNGTWTGDAISGDVAGRFITSTKMGPMTGNLIGSSGAEAEKWQAANIGIWEGSQLYFASSFAPYFEYFNGSMQKMTNDVFMNARFGGTGSLFAGGTPAFTAIGIQGMPNSYGHIWGQRIYSASPATGQYTTYDNGAYWSYLGGILYPCGGTGVRSMLGSWYGVYIAPSSPYAAGYFTGNWTGPSYWYVGAFELDGTVALTKMTDDVGSIPGTGAITPTNFYEIVRKRYFAPNMSNYFAYGSFGSGEGYISGTFDLDAMHIPGQNWGIYMSKSGGWFYNPNNKTTWSTVTGGTAQFGSYNLNTMTGGTYLYSDNGYYRYSYFNDYATNPTGRNQLGYVSYRQGISGYQRAYNANGYIGQQNFEYGDPYGRGRSYWYYTGATSSPWTGDLATVIADAPGGWETSGTGPGTGQTVFFIADTTGTVNGVQLNGNESGTYIGQTMMGAFDGNLLGTIDSDTYQAISFGTWSNDTPLTFYSGFLNYVYYGSNPDGTGDIVDGYMWFNMGGTDPLFGEGTTVNASVMGEYVTGAPLLNNIWYTPMQGRFTSNNRIDGTNTTYDGGAYMGFAGATIIPGATTDAIDFMSYMMYVDGSGSTGVLYANIPGTGYPESMVFEGEGTIKRTQLGTEMPFAAKDLVTYTQMSTGPKTTDWGNFPPYGHTNSDGVFFDANFRQLGDMTERWDRTEILSFTEPYNTTYGFGLWKMNSLGAYDPSTSSSYYHFDSDQIWTNESPYYLTRYLNVSSNGTWLDGKLNSDETYGYWANWRSGRTALMAGKTIGAFNDSEGAFSAFSMGAWFGTPIYMNLANTTEGRQALADLGFPSELTTTVTFSGSQPSLPGTNVTLPINIYSYATPPTSFAHKTVASNSISGTYSGQQIDYIGNMIVTNPGETFFASFWIPQAAHSDSSGTDNWIGELWGSGAIQVDSSYIQGNMNGYGAGQFTGLATTSGNFWGQFAGEFSLAWYMSWITPNPSSKTRLYYYNGESVEEDGYFKGVFDGNGPLDLWSTSESNPLDLHMLGIYKRNVEGTDVRTSPQYASHIFSGEIFSMNYTNSTNTTLDGGAYWGQWAGIQRDFPSDGGGGKSIGGYLGGLAISPTGKVSGLFGHFGDVGDNPDWGWFDPNNAQWQAGGEWYAVELGTSAIAPANLTSNIDDHFFYYNTSASGGWFDGSGYITMENIEGVPQGAQSSWISDSPYAGLWTTGFFGAWNDPSGGTAGWQYEIKGATSETTDLGVLIAGNPWANMKFEGNAVGYWASIEDITGTGVLSGRVLGTFDPSSYTYMAVGIGSWMETNKFLELAATEAGRNKLAQMHIPCVQVGMADLKGSAGGIDMSSGSYGMLGVKFFALTSGGKPNIFATNSVSGAYSSNPVGVNVPLSGGGLNASFTMQNMNANKWLGAVNGSGNLTSGGVPTTYTGPIQFKGAGAGTYTGTTSSGTFSGTAAGHVK